MRLSTSAQANAIPSLLPVDRPISSTSTRKLPEGLALIFRWMAETSSISARKDDTRSSISSDVSLSWHRVRRPSRGAKDIASAGTKQPHEASTTSRPTCLRYVDLPAMLGPYTSSTEP